MNARPTLRHARLVDLPLLALITGAAMGTRTFGKWLRWPLAILSWPCWLAVLWMSTPNVWRIEHHATITIRPPGAPPRPPLHRVAGMLLVLLALEALVRTLLRPGQLAAVLLTVGLAFVLVDVGPGHGRLWHPGPQAVHRSPPVVISTAASVRPGSGLLRAAVDLIDQTWPEAPVEAVARSRDLVPLYQQVWNLTQSHHDCGRMTRAARTSTSQRTRWVGDVRGVPSVTTCSYTCSSGDG